MTRRSETLLLKPGVCRICGCTQTKPCRLLVRDLGELELATPLGSIVSPFESDSLQENERIEHCWWMDTGATLCSNPHCVGAVPLETLLELGIGQEPATPAEEAAIRAYELSKAAGR